MVTTIRARFDGEVFRPEEPVELAVGASYVITIEADPWSAADRSAADDDGEEVEYPLTQLRRLAVDLGVDDLSARHDWYAHGKIEDETP